MEEDDYTENEQEVYEYSPEEKQEISEWVENLKNELNPNSETQNVVSSARDNLKRIKEKYSPQKKPTIDNSLENILQKEKKDIAERKPKAIEEIEKEVEEKVDRIYSYNKKMKDWDKTYENFVRMLTSRPSSYSEVIKKRKRIAVGSPSEDKKDKIKRFLESYGGRIKPKYFEELRLSDIHPIETPSYFLIKPQIEKELSETFEFSLPAKDYTEKALENERKKQCVLESLGDEDYIPMTDKDGKKCFILKSKIDDYKKQGLKIAIDSLQYELQKSLKLTGIEKISRGFRKFAKGVKKSPKETVGLLVAGKEKAKTIYQGLKELKKLYPEKEGIRNPDCISNLDILKFIGDPNREPIYKLTEGADNCNKEKSSEKLKLLGQALISYHYPEEKYLRKTPKSVGERIISEKYLLEETIFETKMEVFTRLTDKGYSSEKITKRFQDAGFNEKFG